MISFGQVDKSTCKVIQFLHKDSLSSESKILPVYHPRGFMIIKNGVYDFVINGKKYYQALVINIDSSKLYISQNWEFNGDFETIKDTLSFLINQELKVRLVSIDKGFGGLPYKVNNKDYLITVTETDKYCQLKNAVITTGKEIVQGHYYFTAYGLKNIKIIKGKPYLCEDTGEYILRRK
jgi:hypothetical protein